MQVTWISAVFALAGAVAFAAQAYALGAGLAFVGIITDCIDGDLARLVPPAAEAEEDDEVVRGPLRDVGRHLHAEVVGVAHQGDRLLVVAQREADQAQ
jgi:hypothetical protein